MTRQIARLAPGRQAHAYGTAPALRPRQAWDQAAAGLIARTQLSCPFLTWPGIARPCRGSHVECTRAELQEQNWGEEKHLAKFVEFNKVESDKESHHTHPRMGAQSRNL
eukprot:355265-Chlamydomonas_euryale.AAC.12